MGTTQDLTNCDRNHIMSDQDFMKNLGETEKKAVEACEKFYQKEEGKDWHVTGLQECKKDGQEFKISLMLCAGDQCTMKDFTVEEKDGKFVAALVEDDDAPF